MSKRAPRLVRPRIPHDEARALIDGVLQRLDSPTPHLRHVERLVVFGSFAYGLLDVDDVDLAIDYVANDAPDRAALAAAATALDEALRPVEALELQLEQDSRNDARELASDLKWLRREIADSLPPVSDYVAPLRGRQVPAVSAPAPPDDDLRVLAESLQRGYDDWAAALKKRVPLPAGTPPVAGSGFAQMITALTGGSDRIYVHPDISAIDDWEFEDVVLLWERGDTLAVARSRLAAIRPDPQATKKPRKARPRGR